MRAYIIRRLLISIPLVFLMTFVIFAVINLDPQTALDRFILNPNISFQVIEQVKEQTGFYDAMPVRYMKWLGGVLFDIRIGRPRRSLVSFADPRQFPETFAADTAFDLGVEPIELGPERREAPLLATETAARRMAAVAASAASFALEVEALERASSESPPVLVLTLRAEGEDTPVFETRRPLTEEGTVVFRADAPALQAAGVWKKPLAALDVRLEGEGRAAVRSVKTALDHYAIRRPERRRPYLSIVFPAAESRFALGQPGSPHITHRLRRTDWAPRGKTVGADERGEPVVWKEGFRSLRIEMGNPGDAAAAYDLRVISGPEDAPRTTSRTFRLAPRERAAREFPLSDLAAGGADLENVRALEWAAHGPSHLIVYRVELVVDAPPVTIGWIPNFGRSHDNIPVLDKLGGRIRNTVLLVIASMLITWIVALPAGVAAAVRQYKMTDKMLSFLTFIGMALPSFFLAVLVRYLLQEAADPRSPLSFLPDLPDSGRTSIHFDSLTPWRQYVDLFRHAIAPTLVLALGGMAGMQRVMRGTMLETQRQPFIVTARAKGLSERAVIYKHALRNAITPFVAGFGSILPALIGGSLFVEMVFNYPGVGQMMLPAVMNRDLNLVMANTLIAALLLVVGNLISDILLAIVDPRVSYG